MIIHDRIYGTIKIKDPLIKTLIETIPFQRLKKVNQYGGVNFIYPNEYQISRYEHSIGVWHILNTLNTSLEIQIAGLLHDIGHTAFSHMVDHAMNNKDENFHEHNLHLIEGWEEINLLLKKNNIILKSVDEYSEIKMQMPFIGADRLDYGLRDYIGATNEMSNLGTTILNDIKLHNNQIVFQTKSVAKQYATKGLEAMWLVIYEPRVAVVYSALSDILKQGINEKWILKKDLYKDDDYVMNIIQSHKEILPKKNMQLFASPFIINDASEIKHDFIHTKLKMRYFDPTILIKNKINQLSELDTSFSKELEEKIKLFSSSSTNRYFNITFTS